MFISHQDAVADMAGKKKPADKPKPEKPKKHGNEKGERHSSNRPHDKFLHHMMP